ncbi:hypothetical protein OIU79_014735 [Salix purpurea]|uniref:EGF-like domain-containing protein n=1 Tax=Salix purpurea TaxID=77065 RepID=A0A9Q0PRD4_SALPP|nr:hypothetical protein OIU79_014735 [Salix purpurea]
MLLLVGAITGAAANPDVKDGCQEKCGDVSVPYPFGIGEQRCAMNDNFFLKCNSTDDGQQLLWFRENMPARNISLRNGTFTVDIGTSFNCYDKSGQKSQFSDQSITLGSGPFTFSDSRNIFTAVGCDSLALLTNENVTFGAACLSFCTTNGTMSKNNSCSGSGCCQTSIPRGPQLKPRNAKRLWANASSYACGMNTNCSYSDNGQGYRCSCKEGFVGNPYLEPGCQDIDECKDPETYPCQGKCRNTNGDYECKCSLGMRGDGKTGCQGFAITTIIAGKCPSHFSSIPVVAIACFDCFQSYIFSTQRTS